ncbi:hypothetical protein PG995_011404 [Apiospora arundinis]|uniref:Secreted protein n=1 Tax=Apiospora arundinis TaxID=335852 RepID=A0ABR2IV34_9PEZI
MHFLSIAISTTAFASLAVGIESPIPGYGVETLQWKVDVAPGETKVMNGTVEEVYQQILKSNPEFKLGGDAQALRRATHLQKRSVNCGTWPLADKGRIQQGINYLRGVGGAPRNGPGPGNCGRVSCSYNAAIWWCNDDRSPKTLDNWNWIADSAQYILSVCAPSVNQVSGQNFERGNWNTIVKRDGC